MKILILDIYPKKPYRISKDNNGGYGSANRYGSNLISKAISWFVKHNVDWPPLSSVHIAGILKKKGHKGELSATCACCVASNQRLQRSSSAGLLIVMAKGAANYQIFL